MIYDMQTCIKHIARCMTKANELMKSTDARLDPAQVREHVQPVQPVQPYYKPVLYSLYSLYSLYDCTECTEN